MLADTFTVALEGPSDTGKSALAAGLNLAWTHGPRIVLPCYAELLPAGQVPPERARDDAGQLDALGTFLALDRCRRGQVARAPRGTLVIADRCWLSLLAHTFAIEQTGGPAAYSAARKLVLSATDLLQPDLVLLLEASDERRRARTAAGDEGRWFTDPAFNAHFAEFFARELPARLRSLVEQLDADGKPRDVRDAALVSVTRWSSAT